MRGDGAGPGRRWIPWRPSTSGQLERTACPTTDHRPNQRCPGPVPAPGSMRGTGGYGRGASLPRKRSSTGLGLLPLRPERGRASGELTHVLLSLPRACSVPCGGSLPISCPHLPLIFMVDKNWPAGPLAVSWVSSVLPLYHSF